MDNTNQSNSKSFDSLFEKIPFFKQYPHMMPWVGADYQGTSHKKILLIAESHYLPKTSIVHQNTSNWYSGTSNDLSPEELGWTNTREIIGSGENQNWDLGESPGHRIYLNIEKAMLDTGFDPVDKSNMFKFCGYYNFFLRPANEGDSIIFNGDDEKVAMDTLFELLKILNPDMVCVLSHKAWKICENWVEDIQQKDGFRLYDRDDKPYIADFFPHPISQWWNMASLKYSFLEESKAQTGREKFIRFLQRGMVSA